MTQNLLYGCEDNLPELKLPFQDFPQVIFLTPDPDCSAETFGSFLYSVQADTSEYLSVDYKKEKDPHNVAGEEYQLEYDCHLVELLIDQARKDGFKGIILDEVQHFENGHIWPLYIVLDDSTLSDVQEFNDIPREKLIAHREEQRAREAREAGPKI
jgi:hypothetical protein